MEYLDKVLRSLDSSESCYYDEWDMYNHLETTGRYAWLLRDESDYWYLIRRVVALDKDDNVINSMYIALGLNDWFYYDAQTTKDQIISGALDNGLRVYYINEEDVIPVADYIRKNIENADDEMQRLEAEYVSRKTAEDLQEEFWRDFFDKVFKETVKITKRKPPNWSEFVWE
jgi:hypothetical protein